MATQSTTSLAHSDGRRTPSHGLDGGNGKCALNRSKWMKLDEHDLNLLFYNVQNHMMSLIVIYLRGGTRKVGKQKRNRRKNEGERAGKKT